MNFFDSDSNLKSRIFDKMKNAIELEAIIDGTFKSNKISTLYALGIGSVIKKHQRNILKQVQDDIDKFISG